MARVDVSIADVFANDSAVLVSTKPLSPSAGAGSWSVRRAVFSSSSATVLLMNSLPLSVVKAQDAKRKLTQHILQNRLKIGFRKCAALNGPTSPLRDLIDGVDMINALGIRLIALMHRVQAQKARLGLVGLLEAFLGPGGPEPFPPKPDGGKKPAAAAFLGVD